MQVDRYRDRHRRFRQPSSPTGSAFKQILFNLLSNAVKFTPEGGSIQVEGGDYGDVLRDFGRAIPGVGIPKEEHEAGFRQVLSGRIDHQGRAGRNGPGSRDHQALVEEHGGRIWVESEPGKGSRYFTIPFTDRA